MSDFQNNMQSRKVVHNVLELGAAFLKLKIVILQHFLCDSRKRKSCSGKTRCIVFDIRCTYMLLKSSLGEFDFADGRRYF